jgi:hypothetical protein
MTVSLSNPRTAEHVVMSLLADRPMRRIVLLCALCGCASAATTSENTIAKQAVIFSSDQGTILGERPRASVATIAAAPAAVWLAAKKVFADLDVPLIVENTSTHQMGNPNFYKSRMFAGEPMSQLVDCGSGMTGPKASTYRIYISLLTSIATDGKGGTTVQTTFVPMGQDISAGSADRIPCGSTGRFEANFLDRIQKTLGK